MKKFACTAIATLALFATTLFGADINGKWTAESEGRDGQKRTTTFNLKSEGDKLTGTVSGMGGQERDPGRQNHRRRSFIFRKDEFQR